MSPTTSTSTTSSTPSSSTIYLALVGAGAIGAAAYAYYYASSQHAQYVKTGVGLRARTAAPAAMATMAGTFPSAVPEAEFVKAVVTELAKHGFKSDNTIALVNTCRDEVCRPIVNLIDQAYGMSFNISGLGALINCGKTGFKAAFSHSPLFPSVGADGKPRDRYIFFSFPHISVHESGEVGSLLRRGRAKPSHACGALLAIKADVTNGKPVVEDVDDAEYALLKKKVVAKIGSSIGSGGPTLVQTTKAALAAISDDLERLIAATVNPATADYAVITGVQIHSGNQACIQGDGFHVERTCDYIAPDTCYAVVNGQRHDLQIKP